MCDGDIKHQLLSCSVTSKIEIKPKSLVFHYKYDKGRITKSNKFKIKKSENFDIEYEINENATIDIYDIKDAKVDSFAINRGHNTIKWNAKKISKGTYILKLYTSDKKFVTSKTVIKN